MHHQLLGKVLLLFLLSSCASHPPQAEGKYTPAKAVDYVRYWSVMIDSPGEKDLYERAISGDFASIAELIIDPRDVHGPADGEGDGAFVLAGAFLVILGDLRFSKFVRSRPPEEATQLYEYITYGPYEHSPYTLPERYPRTYKALMQGIKRSRPTAPRE